MEIYLKRLNLSDYSLCSSPLYVVLGLAIKQGRITAYNSNAEQFFSKNKQI